MANLTKEEKDFLTFCIKHSKFSIKKVVKRRDFGYISIEFHSRYRSSGESCIFKENAFKGMKDGYYYPVKKLLALLEEEG